MTEKVSDIEVGIPVDDREYEFRLNELKEIYNAGIDMYNVYNDIEETRHDIIKKQYKIKIAKLDEKFLRLRRAYYAVLFFWWVTLSLSAIFLFYEQECLFN
jgi:hypothetical protein